MVIQLAVFAEMWSTKINQSASPRNKSMRRSRSAASTGCPSRFETIARFARLLMRPAPLAACPVFSGHHGSAGLVAVWSVVLDAREPTFRVRETARGPTLRSDASHRVAVLVVPGFAVVARSSRDCRGRAEQKRNRDNRTKFAGHRRSP